MEKRRGSAPLAHVQSPARPRTERAPPHERFRHDRLKGLGELLDHMGTEAEAGTEAETEPGGGES
ncbi:hypothetical protein ACFY3M_07725 [Streptomyces mirabilis]|uniref:hypothetical protein n=1 Tax=Streptomyces mirabilis TaxID=68239 RepID=UPI00369A6C4B